MNKEFQTPTVELICYSDADIITTSNTTATEPNEGEHFQIP